MNEQTLFSEEELARVETEEERRHLIECAKDESKIDMKYYEIMKSMICSRVRRNKNEQSRGVEPVHTRVI